MDGLAPENRVTSPNRRSRSAELQRFETFEVAEPIASEAAVTSQARTSTPDQRMPTSPWTDWINFSES